MKVSQYSVSHMLEQVPPLLPAGPDHAEYGFHEPAPDRVAAETRCRNEESVAVRNRLSGSCEMRRQC